jgi:innexin
MLKAGAIPHPGIGPVYPDEKVTFHAYYQWVPFVLFGVIILFF